MKQGVVRDLEKQRKKAENKRLLDEQMALQQKLQSRNSEDTRTTDKF